MHKPIHSKQEEARMLEALQDIVLMVGDARTETEHRVRLIAERAIAKAKGR